MASVPMRGSLVACACVLGVLACTGSVHAGLTFQFTFASNTPQGVQDGFAQGAALWSSVLYDDVTVNLAIDYWAAGGAISLANGSDLGYAAFRDTLTADGKSAVDQQALATLPAGASFPVWINRTLNNPAGPGSATAYLDNDGDANNQTIALTYANAKALGLRDAHDTASDGTILIDESYRRAGSVSARLAAHEIGHALGFLSGVDALDYNSTGTFYNDDHFALVSPIDLFRFSTTSRARGAIDWTADTRDKFFSLDRGATKIASFATGDTWGNGVQNSHWRLGSTGVMGYGSASVTSTDVMMLDAIGWDTIRVPEPTTGALAVAALLIAITLAARRRGRGQAK